MPGAWYLLEMRVIASSTLHGYVRNRLAASQRRAVDLQLRAWIYEVERAEWRSSAELKSTFRSASVINAERVVFNIKGNEHRLVAAIDYKNQILLVKWLGTHKEYDELDVAMVMYDKERYADSTHTQ
jgi:mRNA interferase HigB